MSYHTFKASGQQFEVRIFNIAYSICNFQGTSYIFVYLYPYVYILLDQDKVLFDPANWSWCIWSRDFGFR